MTAKVRLEWLAMASVDSARGQVEEAIARSYGSQTLDVGAVSLESEAAPGFAGERGLARVIVLSGAVYVTGWGDATADGEDVLAFPGSPQTIAVTPGQRLAFIEAPAIAAPVGNAPLVEITVAFAAGDSISAEIDIGSAKVVGITVPNGWTTADLAVSVANGAAFSPAFDQLGVEQLVKVGALTAARRVAIDAADFLHLSRFKLRSVLNGAAVPQVAARTLTVIIQP
ncbi:hypothetical protein [Brevundimonas bacteroides]|uniref:hypothetical protein n=1 Tax=Brevundimonas bacteroides TaxID=74311 RepID=UPI0004966570|nr:hypothetical protein [Brevundimonas bacteroides]